MAALGIDVGTTTVKVCVTNDCNKIASNSLEHDALICFGEKRNENLLSGSFYEQDVTAIITTLDKCLCKMRAHLNDVKKIAVTGQMHGVLLWKKLRSEKEEMYESFSDCFNKTVQRFSTLITWEDKRCSQDFLKTLPASLANCNLHSGFGFASLIWLQQHSNDLFQFDCCGTIMDFVVWLFTQTELVYMTSHNANSWGYYDIREKSWETDVLSILVLLLMMLLMILCLQGKQGSSTKNSINHSRWWRESCGQCRKNGKNLWYKKHCQICCKQANSLKFGAGDIYTID